MGIVPLCYHVGTRAFGKGLLVDEELARAIRLGFAVVSRHWWVVSESTVGNECLESLV